MYFNACSAHYQYTYQFSCICPHQRQFHITFNKYLTANLYQIYIDTHIYYLSYFIHKRLKQATATAIGSLAAVVSLKPIAVGLNEDSL
jgi:hypothetical protein